MSSKPGPAIWSRDNGQRIPSFDRHQLIITWMSNIKGERCEPRLHVSVNLYLAGVRAYAPTSNTTSHDHHEKSNSWVAMSMVLRLTDFGPLGLRGMNFEHNTMSPARVRTQTARSRDERTNYEATTPPTCTYERKLL